MSLSVEKENCHVCTKIVYPTERVAADEKVFHKGCFRCKTCNGVLKLGSFASMEGVFFCKPCFKKNFFSKGNYSSGFGKLTPQQEHDLKTGRVTDGNGISSVATPSKDFTKAPVKTETKESPKEVPKPVKEVPKESPKEAPKPAVKEVPKESPKSPVKEPPAKESPKEVPSAEAKKEARNSTRSLPIAPAKESPKTEPVKESPKPETPKNDPPKAVEPVKPKESPKVVEVPKKVDSPSSSSPSTSSSPGGKIKKCQVCGKSVYPMEELKADDNIFHKTCFRCKKCNGVLKLGSYASMEGEVFCKTCFKKNFFSKGNYSDGFGKLTPQQEHDAKTGRDPTKAFAIGSFGGMESAKRISMIAETKPVETKPVETKPVETKPAETKQVKTETKVEPKVEAKQEIKKEEPKQEEPKKEELKKEEPKQEVPKQEEPKQEIPAETKEEPGLSDDDDSIVKADEDQMDEQMDEDQPDTQEQEKLEE